MIKTKKYIKEKSLLLFLVLTITSIGIVLSLTTEELNSNWNSFKTDDEKLSALSKGPEYNQFADEIISKKESLSLSISQSKDVVYNSETHTITNPTTKQSINIESLKADKTITAVKVNSQGKFEIIRGNTKVTAEGPGDLTNECKNLVSKGEGLIKKELGKTTLTNVAGSIDAENTNLEIEGIGKLDIKDKTKICIDTPCPEENNIKITTEKGKEEISINAKNTKFEQIGNIKKVTFGKNAENVEYRNGKFEGIYKTIEITEGKIKMQAKAFVQKKSAGKAEFENVKIGFPSPFSDNKIQFATIENGKILYERTLINTEKIAEMGKVQAIIELYGAGPEIVLGPEAKDPNSPLGWGYRMAMKKSLDKTLTEVRSLATSSGISISSEDISNYNEFTKLIREGTYYPNSRVVSKINLDPMGNPEGITMSLNDKGKTLISKTFSKQFAIAFLEKFKKSKS